MFQIICSILLVLFIPINLSQSDPIVLRDDTPKGFIISKAILPNLHRSGYKMALLRSEASEYFQLNDETGQLISAKLIDKDRLCMDSKLCCPSFKEDKFHTGRLNYHSLSNLCAHIYTSQILSPPAICTFNLSVSVIASPRDRPDVNDITIVICEDNDHVPEFKLPPGLSSSDLAQAQQMEFRAFPREQPLLIVNVSESAPITTRLRLPLAEDLDSPPFNVQRYELDNASPLGTNPDMSKSVQQMFRLNVIYDNMALLDPDSGAQSSSFMPHSLDMTRQSSSDLISSDQPRVGHSIVGLELLLLDKLDREKMEQYRFRILAMDGGITPRTGTLQIQINVLDANDHAPVFSQSIYETSVQEGVIKRSVLQISATDQDKGVNALVHYGWPKGSEWVKPNQSSSQDQSIEILASRPPGFWFSLDEQTGILAVRYPLDYEIKPKHVFHVLAYNPISSGMGSNKNAELGHSSMTATAKVVINVINTNDEAPVIQIDYVTGESNKTFKSIAENQPSPYFIAFITAYDPDYDGDTNMISSGSEHLGFSIQTLDSSEPVRCQLDSQSAKSYDLTEASDHHNSNPSRVRYTLSTRIPLDREKSAEDQILISCRDSGPSPKTSTATAMVKILDENDCTPEVHVSVLSSQSSHHGRIQPWSEQKLRLWIENQEKANTLTYSPIYSAYLTNVPVFTVSIAENQPTGTVFARLKALDADAGENGRVSFEMLKTTLFLNLSDSIRLNQPKFVALNHDQAEIASSPEAFEYFQIDANSGDLSTRRLIDREEDYMIHEQVFVFIKAMDNGSPEVRSSIILLDVLILDENDNAPFFVESKLHFSVEENLPAPAIVGEIRVIDPDLNPNRMLETDPSYAGSPSNPKFPYQSNGQSDSKYFNPTGLASSFGVSHQSRNSLQLHIDPVNGRRDLPFILYRNANNQFFLNTTRALDRELEEAFQFKIIATDRDPTQIRESVGLQSMLKRAVSHTATALVLISVIDVNDNHPEIIFPSPTTSNSTVHRLSYREYAGYEIVSINANDRDNEKSNGKFHFELVPDLKGTDLFMIDRTSGMLRTRRRLTTDDLGEHLVQVVVRDEGDPPLETRLSLRIVVDQSEPHWQYDPRTNPNGNYDSLEYLNGKQQVRIGLKSSNEIYKAGPESETLMRMHDRRILSSDLVLFVIIAFILALILVILGICIYLRHTRNVFHFMPDLCDFCAIRLPWSNSPTDRQSSRSPNEKSYAKSSNGRFESTDQNSGASGLGNTTYRYSNDLLNSKRSAQLKLGSLASISSPPTRHTIQNKPQSPLSNQHLDSQLQSSINLSTPYSNYQPRESNNFGLVDCSRPMLVNTMQFSPNICDRKSRIPNGTLYRPGTTLAVNVPDVADQAETLRKQHGSYYPFSQTIVRPGYSNEGLLKAHEYQSAENGLLHTYNMGKHRMDTDDRIYFANDFNAGSPEQHLPLNQKFWAPAANFGFRPIDEHAHFYQAIPAEDLNMNDCCNPSPPILVSRPHGKVWCTPYPKPDQPFLNPTILNHQSSHLGHWKSDPSLNQSNPDLTQTRGKLADNLLRTNYYDKIDVHHTELKKIPDTTTLRLKRSKSSKYNTNRSVNKSSVPYYSSLHEPASLLDQTDQGLIKPLLTTSSIDQDGNSNNTNNTSTMNSELNNTSTDISSSNNNNNDDSNNNNNNRHYAVSFPTVQASFV